MAPIHKGGSIGEAKNYKMVKFTAHIIKVFDKIVGKDIIEFLKRTGKKNDSLHGFRSRHSTLSELLVHFDRIPKYLQGEYVIVVYLDGTKDFNIVLNKLKVLGITGKLGRWIFCFLKSI